jgi:hypothetical protein
LRTLAHEKEPTMHTLDAQRDPEQLIALMNRKRHTKLLLVIAGLILGLATLFTAAAAMYSQDTGAVTSSAAER